MELVSVVKESALQIHVKMEVYAKKATILSRVIAGKFSNERSIFRFFRQSSAILLMLICYFVCDEPVPSEMTWFCAIATSQFGGARVILGALRFVGVTECKTKFVHSAKSLSTRALPTARRPVHPDMRSIRRQQHSCNVLEHSTSPPTAFESFLLSLPPSLLPLFSRQSRAKSCARNFYLALTCRRCLSGAPPCGEAAPAT